MTKKYSEFFRKQGNPASVVPEMLAELKASDSVETRKLYYVQKLNDVKNQQPMTSQADIRKAVESAPDDKVAVCFNVQHLNLLKEGEFRALDAYIELAKGRGVKSDFYRGFYHGPTIVWALMKKHLADKPTGGKSFYDYPTVVLYL